MSPRTKQIVLACVALLVAGAGLTWWLAARNQAQVAAVIPALPDLTQSPAMLRERVVQADAKARRQFGA